MVCLGYPSKSLSFWGYPVPRFLWFREPDHQKRLQNEGLLHRNTQTNTFNIFIHDLDSILSRFANNTKPGVADKPDGCTAFSGNLTVWKNEQTWISQSLYGKCKYEYPHSPVQAGTNCLESSLKEKNLESMWTRWTTCSDVPLWWTKPTAFDTALEAMPAGWREVPLYSAMMRHTWRGLSVLDSPVHRGTDIILQWVQ